MNNSKVTINLNNIQTLENCLAEERARLHQAALAKLQGPSIAHQEGALNRRHSALDLSVRRLELRLERLKANPDLQE